MSDMKDLSLDDLIPQDAELKINDKAYTLRKFNLEDEAWLKKKYGKDVDKIFSELRWEEISVVVYRLLKEKDDFLPKEVEGYDDDGNKVTVKKTGPQVLMTNFSSLKEKMELFYALTTVIGISRPMIDEAVEKELKKNSIIKKKQASAGAKSSTQLQANTDTP